MAIHTAVIKPTLMDSNGNVVDKNTATQGQVLNASMEMIVQVDATNAPNATGSQTIQEYLAAEDAAGFFFKHMDNVFIVTADTA